MNPEVDEVLGLDGGVGSSFKFHFFLILYKIWKNKIWEIDSPSNSDRTKQVNWRLESFIKNNIIGEEREREREKERKGEREKKRDWMREGEEREKERNKR